MKNKETQNIENIGNWLLNNTKRKSEKISYKDL